MSARVSDLEVAAQQHQAIVKDLETRLHKSESELTRAMRHKYSVNKVHEMLVGDMEKVC